MKALAWINMVIASLMALYCMAGLPDAYNTEDRFGIMFAIVVFVMFAVYPGINLFKKKK
jgi:hypothetical protein